MRNRVIKLAVMFVIIIMINSCTFETEPEYHYFERIVLFNIDGSGYNTYPATLGERSLYTSSIIPMNDNIRFVLCNKDLFIINTETDEVSVHLTDIDIDFDYSIYSSSTRYDISSLSKDDQFFTFSSDYEIYIADMNTMEYENVTSGYRDEYPRFGLDNTLYFSRYDEENDIYKLMSLDTESNELAEICTCEGWITDIFPGNIDENIVYYVVDEFSFRKVDVRDNDVSLLHDFPAERTIVSRTNDDRYFNFSYDDSEQYLYDTELDVVQTYMNETQIWGRFSKVLPDRKIAITIRFSLEAEIKLWDIDSNLQYGEGYVLDRSGETGRKVLALSPDGLKAMTVYMFR
jgi:hypothetical protein